MIISSLAIVLVMSVVLITAIAISNRWSREDKPNLRKVNDGWVLLQRRDSEHFCEPPDTRGEAMQNTDEDPDYWYIRTNYLCPDTRWMTRDLWLCACGRAWKIWEGGSIMQKWQRSPKDDL